jgi:hypothetical protein
MRVCTINEMWFEFVVNYKNRKSLSYIIYKTKEVKFFINLLWFSPKLSVSEKENIKKKNVGRKIHDYNLKVTQRNIKKNCGEVKYKKLYYNITIKYS